jgi:hypothetical protein
MLRQDINAADAHRTRYADGDLFRWYWPPAALAEELARGRAFAGTYAGWDSDDKQSAGTARAGCGSS